MPSPAPAPQLVTLLVGLPDATRRRFLPHPTLPEAFDARLPAARRVWRSFGLHTLPLPFMDSRVFGILTNMEAMSARDQRRTWTAFDCDPGTVKLIHSGRVKLIHPFVQWSPAA